MRTALILALSVCCLLGHVFGQEQPAQTEGNAWLRFSHGTPVGGPVDVYIDNLPTPSWNWVPFQQVTAYKAILSGQHTITLIRANATRMGAQENAEQQQRQEQDIRPLSEFFSEDDILLNANIDLNEQTFYSFAWPWQAGQQSRQEDEQQVEGLIQSTNTWSLYIDSRETVEGQARLRFIHLIRDFGEISVFLQPADQQDNQQEQALAENLSFLNASDYMTVEPGNYNIIIRGQQDQQTQEEDQQNQQRQEENQQQELGRIERIQLLADNTYTGWLFEQPEQQDMSQVIAVLKFDNFELIRQMSGQNSQ